MVGINEVAKAAGVSISTVSYALSGKRPVTEETRRRVQETVERLGYTPNARARALAGKQTRILALTEPLHEYTHAPTHMTFVLAASVAARRLGYDILLLTDEDAAPGMSRVALSGLVDGILVLDVAPDDVRADLARSLDLPTVFIGVPESSEGLVCVDLDFVAAGALAVDAFAEAGHRTIGLLGHAADAYEVSNFPPRVRDGFLTRAQERGLEAHFEPLSGDGSLALQVVHALDALLARGVTAIALHNGEDEHEVVLEAVARRGLTVPGDVSLISVGASFDTALLPVPMDAVPLVAQRSCDLAVELATDSATRPGVRLIAPELVDHGSIAQAPVADG